MASRSYLNEKTAPLGAVKRFMEKPTGNKDLVKPGGAPLDDGVHIVPDNPTYRAQGRGKPVGTGKFGSTPPANPVLSGKKRKNLKQNLGLKNAAARRLSKIGASKFQGRAS